MKQGAQSMTNHYPSCQRGSYASKAKIVSEKDMKRSNGDVGKSKEPIVAMDSDRNSSNA
jgi:hypothetical protein